MGIEQSYHEGKDAMTDTVLTLIKETPQQDEYGVQRVQKTAREIMAKKASVTRAEFFGGGRAGLNPSMVFHVFHGDYEDETVCEYKGKRYAVYRTFEDGDYIELYCQREGGTNG